MKSRHEMKRSLKLAGKLLAVTTTVSLAGCAGQQLPVDVAGSECKLFVPANYEILGKTRWDQEWIDRNIERGIAGCGWPRPKVRPTNWDQAVVYAQEVQRTTPVVKRSVWQRVRDKFKRKEVPARTPVVVPRSRPPEAPVVQREPAPVPYLQPTPLLQPVRPAEPKKRSLRDDLLGIK